MKGNQDVAYVLDFSTRRRGRNEHKISSSDRPPVKDKRTGRVIPRIARLMALAIWLEGLVREETIQDYAELARLGGVTRARMTQIMSLLQLAPDLQEQILFLPAMRCTPENRGLNERNLRGLVGQLDWSEQRRMFQKIILLRT